MKVSIVNVQCPFVRGGAEALSDSLARRVAGRGHRVAQVNIPFKWYPFRIIPEHMLACRMLNVGAGDPDLVIALKFPAYLCPFPRKRLWLLHQLRQAYELWGTDHGLTADTPEARGVRDLIVHADNTHLRAADRLYTISENVSGRLERGNGITADDVLYPPLDRPELYGPGEFGDYFFYPSRLSRDKRQHVAVEAMRHVRSPFRLVFAGKPDSDAYGEELARTVERFGVADRVRFLGRVSEDEKAAWVRAAAGVVYIPYDEDYGLVTLEAFHSHKPLVTFTDAGGPNELVEHGRNGLSVEPTAEALADAMETLWRDRARAREMGRDAADTLTRHRIDWEHVLDRLLD